MADPRSNRGGRGGSQPPQEPRENGGKEAPKLYVDGTRDELSVRVRVINPGTQTNRKPGQLWIGKENDPQRPLNDGDQPLTIAIDEFGMGTLADPINVQDNFPADRYTHLFFLYPGRPDGSVKLPAPSETAAAAPKHDETPEVIVEETLNAPGHYIIRISVYCGDHAVEEELRFVGDGDFTLNTVVVNLTGHYTHTEVIPATGKIFDITFTQERLELDLDLTHWKKKVELRLIGQAPARPTVNPGDGALSHLTKHWK